MQSVDRGQPGGEGRAQRAATGNASFDGIQIRSAATSSSPSTGRPVGSPRTSSGSITARLPGRDGASDRLARLEAAGRDGALRRAPCASRPREPIAPAALASVGRATRSLLLGDNLDVLPRLRGRRVPARLRGSRRSTRAERSAAHARDARRSATGDRTGFGGRRYAHRASLAESSYRGRVRRLPRLPRAAPARDPPRARRDRDAVFPHRLPRGALLQGAARRALRPGVLPERDRLGLRLRGAHRSAAGPPSTTRSSSTSRIPAGYCFDAEAVEREPYMAPGLVTAGEGGAGEAPDGRLVAHDRVADGQREDRLSDAEAGGRSCAAWCRPPRRPGDRCLDPFAGSGTLGAVARALGRRYRPRRLEP